MADAAAAVAAAAAAAVAAAAGGAPPPMVGAPQLPLGADPGTISGWMLQHTASDTPSQIANEMERGFLRIDSLPDVGHADHDMRSRQLTDEVLNSDILVTYLTVGETTTGTPRVTVLHSLARYSAGFGGVLALHGRVVGLLGEVIGDQLPPMILLSEEDDENLVHALTMEELTLLLRQVSRPISPRTRPWK